MGIFRKSSKEEEVEATVEIVSEVESSGPFDAADAPENDALIDCGALLVPHVPGAQLQFTVDRTRNVVLGVVYLRDDSAVQLQVFAAPKSSGLWESVRADMMQSIAQQGGKSREAQGEYGTEIFAHMPVEGSNSVAPVRYIGIDGPRWLLRVTLSGKAASSNDAGSGFVHEVLDSLVVVRGNTAHPPREILELRLPQEPTKEPERLSLSLPQRGPEISEVR